MKKVIEYPTDAPLVDHPLYAFTREKKIPVFTDALCAFYECEKEELKGKFKGDKLSTHKSAFQHAWYHINGPRVYPNFGFNYNPNKVLTNDYGAIRR
jgi:hypothetical protein